MKQLITNYTFDASEKKITFTDINPIGLENVLLITNVTDGIIIYNFADSAKGGSVATNVLTLEYDTSSMSDSDNLQIFYDNPSYSQLVDLGSNNDVTLTTLPDTSAGDLAAIESNTDGIEALLGTIDSDTGTIAGDTSSIDSKITACDTGAVVISSGVITSITNSVAVTGTFWQATQPVSGTVTANLSATDNAVLDDIAANQTDASQKTQIVDGSGNVIGATSNALDVNIKSGSSSGEQYADGTTVDAGYKGTIVAGTDGSNYQFLSVTAAGLLNIADGGGAITVDGTVAVTNANLATLAGAVSGTEVQVDVVTMPTTTVTATNLDIRDIDAATDDIAIHGNVGVLNQLDLTNSNPAVVAIVDADGTQITSFGGGTQYTEGDTDATITGTAMMWEDGSDTLRAVSASKPLPVDLGTNNDVTITSGTITTITNAVAVTGTFWQATQPVSLASVPSHAVTNAGTFAVQVNGNALTSLQLIDDTVYTDGSGTPSKGILILGSDGTNPQAVITDSTGHLQVDVLTAPTTAVTGTFWQATQPVSIAASVAVTNADITSCKTALELLDNSVDGNYLNVNCNIAGTDFVGGAGAVAAGVQRVTLASDDPAVTALQLIDDAIYIDDADWTDSTSKHLLVGGLYQSSPQTVTDGDVAPLEIDANGNLKVVGTVTANLSATDNAVLDTIDAVLDTINAKLVSGTVIGDVNLGATDNAVLDTIDAVLDAINAKLVTGTDIGDVTINNSSGANAVYIQDGGNSITVDGTVALGAGSAAIGKLAANSGVDIGDVDVTSIVPGVGATNLGKAEDAAHSTGDVGVMTLAIRDDTLAASSGTEGDYEPLHTDALGALWVADRNAITGIGHGVKTVTTAGTDLALASSTACKKVVIQAQTDNTNLIAVGGSGVDATIATGSGVVLYPGDSFELEIDNLADVYIDSLVNGEGVRFTYFT